MGTANVAEAEAAESGFVAPDAAETAGILYDGGYSCVRAVLEATTGPLSPELHAATAGFSSGIRESGCLCGAVTGGVMALGLKGCGKRSAELVESFRAAFKTTCCRGLSGGYQWMSKEHRDNCRKITAAAAGMVAGMLQKA